MIRVIRGIFLGGLAVLILLAALAGFLYREAVRPGPSPAAVTLILPRGAGLAAIAAALADNHVARQGVFVMAAALALHDARDLKAGEYRFPAAISIVAALDLLREGRVVVHRLTVPEGTTMAEVMRLLKAAYGLQGPLPPTPPEGSILPETYDYRYGDSRAALLKRMAKAMTETLARLWQTRAPGLALTSPEQAVILASIVEKETALPAERPHIAGVFLNRLKLGMRLQSDPTVAYGITLGQHPLGRPLTRADLDADTPYNTYRIVGLPPQAIDNPGQASLAAVMQPQATSDLYFVANGSGGHAFAATLAEHERKVRAWRKIEQPAPAGNGG